MFTRWFMRSRFLSSPRRPWLTRARSGVRMTWMSTVQRVDGSMIPKGRRYGIRKGFAALVLLVSCCSWIRDSWEGRHASLWSCKLEQLLHIAWGLRSHIFQLFQCRVRIWNMRCRLGSPQQQKRANSTDRACWSSQMPTELLSQTTWSSKLS